MCAITLLACGDQYSCPAPKGASDSDELTVSLKRYPDTNRLHELLAHELLACRRSADSFNGCGQLDNEAAADRLVFLDADRTMMVFHYSAHNGQTQPRAALLGREVRQGQTVPPGARLSLARGRGHT